MTPSERTALVRQGKRWLFAAEQDRNPVVAMLHFDYAVAYFTIVDEAAPDLEARTLVNRARVGQDRVARELVARVGS